MLRAQRQAAPRARGATNRNARGVVRQTHVTRGQWERGSVAHARSRRPQAYPPRAQHPLPDFAPLGWSAGVAALRRARFVRGRRAPRPRSVDWQLDSALRARPRALLEATAAAACMHRSRRPFPTTPRCSERLQKNFFSFFFSDPDEQLEGPNCRLRRRVQSAASDRRSALMDHGERCCCRRAQLDVPLRFRAQRGVFRAPFSLFFPPLSAESSLAAAAAYDGGVCVERLCTAHSIHSRRFEEFIPGARFPSCMPEPEPPLAACRRGG